MTITNLLLFLIILQLAKLMAMIEDNRLLPSARISTVTISDGSGTGRTATVLDDGSILMTCKGKTKC